MSVINVEGYGTGGATQTKIWSLQVVADGAGAWSVDYTAAGFTSTPKIFCTGQNNTGTLIDQAWGHVQSASSTAAIGTAIRGANVGVLGAPSVRTAPGASLNVLAIEST